VCKTLAEAGIKNPFFQKKKIAEARIKNPFFKKKSKLHESSKPPTPSPCELGSANSSRTAE
jgi:hypothetical protein